MLQSVDCGLLENAGFNDVALAMRDSGAREKIFRQIQAVRGA